jgi:hypothetical protein
LDITRLTMKIQPEFNIASIISRISAPDATGPAPAGVLAGVPVGVPTGLLRFPALFEAALQEIDDPQLAATLATYSESGMLAPDSTLLPAESELTTDAAVAASSSGQEAAFFETVRLLNGRTILTTRVNTAPRRDLAQPAPSEALLEPAAASVTERGESVIVVKDAVLETPSPVMQRPSANLAEAVVQPVATQHASNVPPAFDLPPAFQVPRQVVSASHVTAPVGTAVTTRTPEPGADMALRQRAEDAPLLRPVETSVAMRTAQTLSVAPDQGPSAPGTVAVHAAYARPLTTEMVPRQVVSASHVTAPSVMVATTRTPEPSVDMALRQRTDVASLLRPVETTVAMRTPHTLSAAPDQGPSAPGAVGVHPAYARPLITEIERTDLPAAEPSFHSAIVRPAFLRPMPREVAPEAISATTGGQQTLTTTRRVDIAALTTSSASPLSLSLPVAVQTPPVPAPGMPVATREPGFIATAAAAGPAQAAEPVAAQTSAPALAPSAEQSTQQAPAAKAIPMSLAQPAPAGGAANRLPTGIATADLQAASNVSSPEPVPEEATPGSGVQIMTPAGVPRPQGAPLPLQPPVVGTRLGRSDATTQADAPRPVARTGTRMSPNPLDQRLDPVSDTASGGPAREGAVRDERAARETPPSPAPMSALRPSIETSLVTDSNVSQGSGFTLPPAAISESAGAAEAHGRTPVREAPSRESWMRFEDLNSQFGGEIRKASLETDGTGRAALRIMLAPENMGTIEAEVIENNNTVTINIVAQTEEVVRVLRENSHALREAFSGHSATEINIFRDTGGSGAQHAGGRQSDGMSTRSEHANDSGAAGARPADAGSAGATPAQLDTYV